MSNRAMSASERRGRNDRIIAEFHATGGHVGGPFENDPLLLLHHRGRRSGLERVNPMVYRPVGDGFAVFATNNGADTDPEWYRNLMAHPDAEVEVGTDVIPVHAHEATDGVRAPIWEAQKKADAAFAGYEARAARTIPVVLLDRRA